jgi:hypothetical protein
MDLCHHHCYKTSSAPPWPCFIKCIIPFFLCIFCPACLPFPPGAYFYASPPLQHNNFGASLGLFYQVRHLVLSLHLLPYFLTFPTRRFLSYMDLCHHHCDTTSSVPAWAWFTEYVIPFFLCIFCPTFLPFPTRCLLLCMGLCHHRCNTTSSVPDWAWFTKYDIPFFLCIFCPTFLPFPPDASFYTWTFVTIAATQHLQHYPGLALSRVSPCSFFVSSALLSYLSHQTLFFTHGR